MDFRWLPALLFLLPAVAPADSRDVLARLKRLNQPVPADLDSSRSRKVDGFAVTYEISPAGPVPLRSTHAWIIRIEGPEGRPIQGATLAFRGGMPQHGHGFQSSPESSEVSPGIYRVEGVKFHMPGWWGIEVEFNRPGGTSLARFDLVLESEMKRLWLGSLPALGTDRFPSNPFALDSRAISLGRALFSDVTLSRDGKTSCATCHRPDRAMSDGRVIEVPGQGKRKIPSLLGVAWQQWFFWDGRKDSLWSQALAPIENPLEYGMKPGEFVARARAKYAPELEAIFGPGEKTVDVAFADLGRLIAAFETTLAHPPAPFDRWVERKLGLAPLPAHPDERKEPFGPCAEKGFKLFTGKARCLSCHFGPRFENDSFHNTGVPSAAGEAGTGRFAGIKLARQDPFRCGGTHAQGSCRELERALDGSTQLTLAFKTPTLRSVSLTPPYMHNGSFKTLEEVIEHYRLAPPNSQGTELLPLKLDLGERKALACFLRTL